jgi:CheY-like chemotaxis protein
MLAPECPRTTESKFRILYLGADLELIAAVRQVLTSPDYRLVACSDRESTVLFLESEIPYDLLLIDLEWRGIAGMKLTEIAHSLGHRQGMPVILVATELSSNLRRLAQKASVNECAVKTPDMAAASEVIRYLLEG